MMPSKVIDDDESPPDHACSITIAVWHIKSKAFRHTGRLPCLAATTVTLMGGDTGCRGSGRRSTAAAKYWREKTACRKLSAVLCRRPYTAPTYRPARVQLAILRIELSWLDGNPRDIAIAEKEDSKLASQVPSPSRLPSSPPMNRAELRLAHSAEVIRLETADNPALGLNTPRIAAMLQSQRAKRENNLHLKLALFDYCRVVTNSQSREHRR